MYPQTEISMRSDYSVLMSVYGKENPAFLKESIQSILDQTVPSNDFVLVCDGPLTPELDAVINSFSGINVIVASKHPSFQWLNMEEAVKHCTNGIGIWEWASNDQNSEPDVVIACAGDTPTLEALAATSILRKCFPDIKIRFVNIVDLMRLESNDNHPHGLTDEDFDINVILECENAILGLEAIKKYKPDVVLMDLGLPEMNGIEAMLKIREF